MKILKAQSQHPKTQTFQISNLTYIKTMTPLNELLQGELMQNPIEIIRHEIYSNRLGANGENYIEKKYSVYRGSQRIQAALQLGYTHIEGIILNDK